MGRTAICKIIKNIGWGFGNKTKDDQTIFSSRATAITRVPLFEALYNSMIK